MSTRHQRKQSPSPDSFRSNPKRPQRLPKMRHLIGALGRPAPSHDPLGIHGKRAANLPATATLGIPVPDPLLGAQLPGVPQRQRVDGIPRRAQPQPPGVIQLALGVDDDLNVPLAAGLDDPGLLSTKQHLSFFDSEGSFFGSERVGED